MKTVRVLALLLSSASALPAQRAALSGSDCGRPAGERCRTRIVTEASYSLRLTGRADEIDTFDGPNAVNFSTSLGFVKPVAPRIGLGAVATFGIWDNFYLAAGARLRLHATPRWAVDLTPGYILVRDQPGDGRAILDASVMYRDIVGLSVQAGRFQQYRYASVAPGEPFVQEYRRNALFAGLRLGSKAGRYGMVADAAALAGTILLYVIVCSNRGCD